MTTILIKKKDTAGAPAAGDLTNAAGGAEIAVNTATKRIYSKDSGGAIIEMGTFPSSMAVQGALSATGNVTLGDAAADTVTVNGTITSNLIFTDNTYDIGASGATRPRNLYLAGDATIGGSIAATTLDLTNLEVTNIKAKDGTASITLADSTGVASFTANPILSGGTANGVAYLNGSKVLTTGSALTFDGTNFGIGGTASGAKLHVMSAGGVSAKIENTLNTGSAALTLKNTAGGTYLGQDSTGGYLGTDYAAPFLFYINNSEQMRLTSTGRLGIGQTNPQGALGFAGAATITWGTTNYPYISADSGVNTISFGTQATERVRIDSAGNFAVGNGTTTANTQSASVFFGNFGTVTGSGISVGGACISGISGASNWFSSTSLGFYTNPGPDVTSVGAVERMRLTGAGNLGLGTTSPTARLDIQGGSIVVGTTTAGDSTVGMTFGKVAAGGGTISNRISLATYGGSYGAYVEAYANLSASTATYLAFGTNAGGGGTPTERARIDDSGRFGIGTSSPATTLDVRGSSSATIRVGSTGNGGSGDEFGNLEFYWADPDSAEVKCKIYAKNVGNVGPGGGGAADLLFATRPPFGALTEVMRIDSNQRIQIGTATSKYSSVLTIVKSANSYNITSSVSGTASSGHMVFENNGSDAVGTIFTAGSTTSYNTSSDYRLKNITGPITNSGAYIDSLEPCEGTWKSDGSIFVGLIAHKTQEVSRTPVATGEKDGDVMQGMDYSSPEIIANLIAEVQSLRKRLAVANI
jgi:hypothetical protein